MSPIELIRPAWNVSERVCAVMTTRKGGVSPDPWNSLNLGIHVGDSPAAVSENRRRLQQSAALPSEPAWLEQVHGTTVVDLDVSSERRGDASTTRVPGVVCAIQVADCMPVLLAARDGSVVGAAHAGWRGLASGVLEETVRTMVSSPEQLVAWLGPAIGPTSFEVGDDVLAAFENGASAHQRAHVTAAFTRNARGRWSCNLYALARLRLQALGIEDISGGNWCTFEDVGRFFSYRRDGQTGRMAALIWLAPT